MSQDLQRDSVIEALTSGVGAEFGRATRKSFYEQLARLERHTKFVELRFRDKQSLVDLLAVACFYHNVIVPIESSAAFVGVLEDAGADYLKVSKYRIDPKFANQAGRITNGFRILLSRVDVPDYLLTYASLGEFINRARITFGERSHGTLD